MRQAGISSAYVRRVDLLGLCPESWLLVAMCLADAISTVLLVNAGLATEYNPIMDWCLKRGACFFLFSKCLTFVPFVCAVELYRRQDPERGRSLGRLAVSCYAALYVSLVALVNLGVI